MPGKKNSETDLYRREQQRQNPEDMLRQLWRAVEQSADLVIITDRSGVMEYVNPAFEILTGYTRLEAIGQTLRILKADEQDPAIYQEMWQTVLAGRVFRGIILNRKKNGENFIVEKAIAPLRDRAGKMDAIGRLAGGVAHDFNNLLMVISAYAELMLDSLAAGDPLRHNAEQIMTASGRATALTRQLLAFGRKQMQTLQFLDLNSIIRDISKLLPGLIGEDIDLVIVAGQKLGRVKADPVQIEQVVLNLAANARDAMPHGGKLTIETAHVRLDDNYVQRHSIVPPGDYVLLIVTDSGEGIERQHLSHIFEPFYTTKEAGKGTGLGLATVYGIVKQSGGFVWVYSEPGLGTIFKIYLPGVLPDSDEHPVAKAPHTVETIGHETLLLVEDELTVRQATLEFLNLRGYIVLEAKNGEDALIVARAHPERIDLMITDVIMPHMGGARLAEKMASDRPLMKVLFVSGYAESTALRQGAIDVTKRFLQKPFSLNTLAGKIREILGNDSPAIASSASAG